ncbi:MAG: DUF5928 domain-containing protein [Pseudomonadota bacterium]|nr:DUF5928 domain-containing protein [Pseudomonadota bacterium]
MRIRETETPEVNAETLEAFLTVPHDQAIDIARSPYLFAD